MIRYDITGDSECFKAAAEALASTIAGLEGFVAKLRLDGQGTGFGCVQLWRDEAASQS